MISRFSFLPPIYPRQLPSFVANVLQGPIEAVLIRLTSKDTTGVSTTPSSTKVPKICEEILKKRIEDVIREKEKAAQAVSSQQSSKTDACQTPTAEKQVDKPVATTGSSGTPSGGKGDPCGNKKQEEKAKRKAEDKVCAYSGAGGGSALLGSRKIVYCEGRGGRSRSALFSMDTLRMNPEVWPIVAIITFVAVGLVGMIGWIATTRDDVRYFKHMGYEQVDLLNPAKRKRPGSIYEQLSLRGANKPKLPLSFSLYLFFFILFVITI